MKGKHDFFDDFFGEQGKCANCGNECDPDRELCATCLNEALVRPKPLPPPFRDNSEDEMEDQ